jgi:hypothetical protein
MRPLVSDLVPLDLWREQIQRSPATLWRWRKEGWLPTINVAGRLYISRAAIATFEARAARGEFSKVHQTPNRRA